MIHGIIASSIQVAAGCTYATFRSKAEYYATSGTSHACSKPTGTVSGDLMFAIVNANSNLTITDPSGWTRIDEDNGISSGATIIILYKVAGGSEPTSYTWTTSSSQRTGITIATFEGSFDADPSNGTHSERVVTTTNDDVGANAMTLTNGCAMVVYAAAFDEPANYVWSALTGWTIVSANDSTNNTCIAYKTFENSGSTGSADFIFTTNASGQKATWLWSFVRND